MALTDEIKFYAKAGNGGNGVVRWRHEKFVDRGGPNGGDGGWGGNVYISASRDIALLGTYKKTSKKFLAGNADDGEGRSKHGANGADLDVKLPVGSVITNESTGEVFEILDDKDRFMILSGGKGGFGNEHFKSSLLVTPTEATTGKPGEEGIFTVELRMIADVGLIGYPNAGKSSLLNILTQAKAKVGNYDFTTLDPNLGAYHGYVLADLPGLIEGASEGRGLGHAFLRHIARTKILVHLVSAENENVGKSYKTIRKELDKWSKDLLKKDEIVVLSKSDTTDAKIIQKKKKELEKSSGAEVFVLSLYDDPSVKEFADSLIKLLQK